MTYYEIGVFILQYNYFRTVRFFKILCYSQNDNLTYYLVISEDCAIDRLYILFFFVCGVCFRFTTVFNFLFPSFLVVPQIIFVFLSIVPLPVLPLLGLPSVLLLSGVSYQFNNFGAVNVWPFVVRARVCTISIISLIHSFDILCLFEQRFPKLCVSRNPSKDVFPRTLNSVLEVLLITSFILLLRLLLLSECFP